MDNFLECKNLSKIFSDTRFNQGVEAIRNLNLSVRKNEFLCIIGPSGCGKTTLLHMMGGLEEPTTGGIYLERKQIKGPSPRRAIVFQDSSLYPWKTVFENVAFGLEIRKVPKGMRKDIAHKYLDILGLKGFENARPHQLSGGMRTKVAIARILALNPDILLMDEPFGSLDEHTRRRLDFELLNIWERDTKTVIFVTHSIEEAIILADRIILLSERPGSIRSQIHISLPHPRNLFSREVVELRKALLFNFINSSTPQKGLQNLLYMDKEACEKSPFYSETQIMGVRIEGPDYG